MWNVRAATDDFKGVNSARKQQDIGGSVFGLGVRRQSRMGRMVSTHITHLEGHERGDHRTIGCFSFTWKSLPHRQATFPGCGRCASAIDLTNNERESDTGKLHKRLRLKGCHATTSDLCGPSLE